MQRRSIIFIRVQYDMIIEFSLGKGSDAIRAAIFESELRNARVALRLMVTGAGTKREQPQNAR